MPFQKLIISLGQRLRCDFPKGSFAPRAFYAFCLIFKSKQLKD